MKIRYYILILVAIFVLLLIGNWLEYFLCDDPMKLCQSFIKKYFLDSYFTLYGFLFGFFLPIILLFLYKFIAKISWKSAIWKMCKNYFLIIFPVLIPIIIFETEKYFRGGTMPQWSEFGLIMLLMMVWFCVFIVNYTHFFVEMYNIFKKKNP